MSSGEQEKIVANVDPALADLLDLFFEKRLEEIHSIEESLKMADFQAIGSRAHHMKGVGGSYGFDRVTSIGAQMEQAAKAGDAKKIRRLLAGLKHYLNNVEVVFCND